MAPEIDHLIKIFSFLPGLGERSARRIVLHLLSQKQTKMESLLIAVQQVLSKVDKCRLCGNLDASVPICSICKNHNRDHQCLCVVENISDLWAIERTKSYNGMYFVLGGALSAIDGVGPGELRINVLTQQCKDNGYAEVILALSSTLNGQTTTHYIREHLTPIVPKVTELARGVPIGGELDYLDDGTLITALIARSGF
ncbi:MAG: recombination mediator RecR [Holosporales bacterium]|jgi:recombination protein RecR|nr:recombination mediator RecR [Holosporales bacterium]